MVEHVGSILAAAAARAIDNRESVALGQVRVSRETVVLERIQIDPQRQQWCRDVLDKMGDRQVRRIPVVDRDHRLAGIISLGDMALQRSGSQVGDALEEISTPSSRGSTASGATGSPDASGPSPTSPDSPHHH